MERAKGIEPSFCAAPRQQIRSWRAKDGYIQPKTKHTCVKICVTFSRLPRSGQFNGLSRARSPYWYGVYSVVSPGSQRRWVRKSTKKRKRSEAKEILDAWQKTADRDAAGNLDQARIREIVLKTVERVTGERTDSPTVAEWLERD
jgi:hypothetical protein